MAVATSLKDLATQVIEQFLVVAQMCVETRTEDGGILGYPAILLLLAAVDAIGHGLKAKGGDTRLSVLTHSEFGQDLKPQQIKNLTHWYRHMLAHNGLIAPGVALTDETEGEPFCFTGEELTLIRVPVLCKLIRGSWDGLKHSFTPGHPDPRGLPKNPAVLGVFGGSASGVTLAAYLAALQGRRF